MVKITNPLFRYQDSVAAGNYSVRALSPLKLHCTGETNADTQNFLQTVR